MFGPSVYMGQCSFCRDEKLQPKPTSAQMKMYWMCNTICRVAVTAVKEAFLSHLICLLHVTWCGKTFKSRVRRYKLSKKENSFLRTQQLKLGQDENNVLNVIHCVTNWMSSCLCLCFMQYEFFLRADLNSRLKVSSYKPIYKLCAYKSR